MKAKKKIWSIDCHARGRYLRKYIEAIDSAHALKKGRVNKSVVDLCIVEHVGQ